MTLRRITAAILLCVLSACAFGDKIHLGKLGQVTEPSKIYARPSTNSQVYFKIQAFAYVVVQPVSDAWLKVLMRNGIYGYVHANTVAKLPYDVMADAAPRNSYRGDNLPAASRSTAAAAKEALNYVGTPYLWGGTDIHRGIDCSGMVQKLFGDVAHIQLPRTAAEQALVGTPVTRLDDLKAGDRLYFWDAKRGKIGHTGLYLGNGYFVHSSRTHNGIGTDYLGQKKWLNILYAARRS